VLGYLKITLSDSKDINAILWDFNNNQQMTVVKPADKSLGPTIMDRKWYIEEGRANPKGYLNL
jgi:hypothetical protein